MAGVDLSTYRFDYDLTFAALLMHPDGTTYHRYGARDHTSATARLSMESLARVLSETLLDHAEYSRNPSPPPATAKRTIEQIPAMARKLQKEKVNCFHCHMVNDAEREQAQEEKRWSREETFGMMPLPDKVGILLDRDDQTLVKGVLPGSPAESAGLRQGDRLVRIAGARVRTEADVQWSLDGAPRGKTSLPVEVERAGGGAVRRSIELEPGWKTASHLEFSWRPTVWGLRPAPGFGGKLLRGAELEEQGLSAGTFAVRVTYIVDWGEHAEDGRSARRAGLREGDVLLSVDGESDFVSEMHFQSWFRFTRKPGETARLDLLRGKERVRIDLPVRA
jgi:hypothetical protein